MSALEDLFARTRAEGRAALVGYLPAGFPSVEGAIDAVVAMVEAGVDAVEVGVPYSDPLMDGPTMQAAAEQALAAGTRMADVLRTVTAVASAGAPALVDDLLEPDRALWRRRVRARLRRRGRLRRDHPRPHPR